jgi:hypothetical protein
MDTIKVMEWAIAGLFTFAGAYYGSSVADNLARRHAEEERQARCLVLCAALRHELGFFSGQVQPYQVEKAIYEPPISLTTPQELLDGGTLEFGTNHELIGSLLNLQASLRNYSDYVQTANLVQGVATLSDDAHRQIYNDLCRRRQQLCAARDEVIRRLPTGEATEPPPSPWSRVLAAVRLLAPIVALVAALGAFWLGRASGARARAATGTGHPTAAPPGSAVPLPPVVTDPGSGSGGRAKPGQSRPRPPRRPKSARPTSR